MVYFGHYPIARTEHGGLGVHIGWAVCKYFSGVEHGTTALIKCR